jgi:hypothetical protein
MCTGIGVEVLWKDDTENTEKDLIVAWFIY